MVFSDRAAFPKGHPEGVVQVREMLENLGPDPLVEPVPVGLRAKWEALEYRIRTGKEARKAHLAQFRSRTRERLGRILTMVLIGLGISVFIGSRIVY
ncbi:hypothetical protein [Thiohalorhabdus methylotrophus]|uniref:Uncharacterized protein n=1 Tax=Thiohalorhabdus methylotrophus TaxID=3242694 RepID=A0ABV4TZJ6_9GAMM